MKECLIAKGTIHGFLKQKKFFKISELHNLIIERGGILRTSLGVTIKDYLFDLEDRKIIKFSIKNDSYLVL